jgi:hypothetical protein
MTPPLAPRKTAAARQLLQASRQSLTPGLRMLLITIDGRKSFADLQAFTRGLGLTDAAFAQLRDAGLIDWGEGAPSLAPAAPDAAERAKSLVRAKFFAMDLAARMLAGRDGQLRELAREVNSETSFHAWIDECVEAISVAGSAERAALFRERVATVI